MTATALQPVVAAAALSVALASSIMNLMSPTRMTEQPAPPANQLTEREKRAGWSLLFDGTSLNGWRGYKKPDATTARWRVEDGWLTVGQNDGKDTRGALDLISVEHFERFELSFEWRVAEGGNSGVKYFVLEDMDAAIGHEYQIIDDERHPDAKIGVERQTAAFYDVLEPSNRKQRPAGQLNDGRIVSDGRTVEHWLNGTRVLQYELDSPALRTAIADSKFKEVGRFGKLQNGHILLQDHGDRIWYRNVKVRRLSAPATSGVQVVSNEGARRVDITIDGKPFTSYIYPTSLKKPVLYPLHSAKGTIVTRGFPLDPRKGERVDHPHHVGLWFNYGDVNGLDFWNNSDAIKPEQAPRMGTIVHRRVTEASGGPNRGALAVEMEWIDAGGVPLVREETEFVFRGTPEARSVDRITTLTALDRRVVFRDNKEGVLGLRVTRALEQPADKPEVFTDADGRPTPVPVLDNTGVTGQYVSSEGLKGDAVWGTRGRWTMLGGTVDSERVTVAILDHPTNPHFPTYWHARGYGLFAANPLGRKVFDPKQEELTLVLEPAQSVTFRHRVVILTGAATPDAIEREYKAFASPTATPTK
jgi:Family of unknown function (DUF6807)/3-keto-disaccharide hydrolase